MNDFVAQCRREWRRLGVPDPLAEEMATELASDLSEAETEGVSAEKLLGTSAFDPPSFAATWAAERGIIPKQPGQTTRPRRPVFLTAFTGAAAIALIVAAALLLTGEPKLSLATSRTTPAGPSRSVVHSVSAAVPIELILLLLAIVALGFAARLWSTRSRSQPPTAPAQ